MARFSTVQELATDEFVAAFFKEARMLLFARRCKAASSARVEAGAATTADAAKASIMDKKVLMMSVGRLLQ